MSRDVQPGWYQNPDGSNSKRYWDGGQWTNAVADDVPEKPHQQVGGLLKIQPNLVDNLKVKENDDIFLIPLYESSKLKLELKILHPKYKNNFINRFEKDSELIESYFDYSKGKYRKFKLSYYDKNTVIAELLPFAFIADGKGNEFEREDLFKLYKLLTENKNLTSILYSKQKRVGIGKWFTKPIYRDWVGIAWLILTFLAWIPAFYRVLISGGPFFTARSIFSGLTDGAVYPVTLFIFFVPPALLTRKIYWNYIKAHKITYNDRYIIALILIFIISVVSTVSYLNYQSNIEIEKSALKSVCVDPDIMTDGCADYPDIQFSFCYPSDYASARFYLKPRNFEQRVEIPLVSKSLRPTSSCSGNSTYFSFKGEGIVDLRAGGYELWISTWSGNEDYFQAPDGQRTVDVISFEVK